MTSIDCLTHRLARYKTDTKNQNEKMYSSFEVFGFCSILSSTMRGVLQATVLGLLTSLGAGVAIARAPLEISTDQPANFSAVEADQNKIKAYIGEAQCGGFNLQESVNGKIATVTGAPGRTGIWDGLKLSGMAARADRNADGSVDNDYQYPDGTTGAGAQGFSTACSQDQDNIQKSVWRYSDNPSRPGEVTLNPTIYPHPKFQDPACRWRVKVGAPTVPLNPKNSYNPEIQYGETTDPGNDRQSPSTCTDFCTYLNTWQYYDCLKTVDLVDLTGNIYTGCAEWGNKYLCTDQKVNDAGSACNPGSMEMGNARACIGSECRCQFDAGPKPVNGCIVNPGSQFQEAPVYYSYFRKYSVNFTRDETPSDIPRDDRERSDVPVACYGFYYEFDPKTHQTEPKDRRCVININVSGMGETQKGKGNNGSTTNMVDIDPLATDQQRAQAGSKDIWYQKLGWGFSLLKEESFKNDYQKNLSSVFLDIDNLDKARQTGSQPIAREGEAPQTAISDRLRAFDDSGNRIVVTWWQKQQNEVATLLHPPVVRLLMPPGYAFGIDTTDVVPTNSDTTDLNTKRSKSIEIQLDASEDMLGESLNRIQKSLLLHLEEEPIPVLVPMGSPTDFRARAQEWCTWYIKNNVKKSGGTCDNAPQEVKDVISKLNEYADRIENVRELRAELATYTGKVVDIQEKLTKPITDWVKDNLTAYQNFLAAQKNLINGVAERWRDTEQVMSDFENKTNLPWCMNQRYELPIYSLLEKARTNGDTVSWLPSRADNGKITADGLPNLTITRNRDIIIDFSGITYMTGSLTLPVLKPVQVRLNIPTPTDEPFDPLPDLPSISAIHTAMDNAMKKFPDVETKGKNYDPLSLPPIDPNQIVTVNNTIEQITDTVRQMDDAYDAFWKSIGPLPGEKNPDTGPDSIKTMKEGLECFYWDDPVCQHVEMDLMERFQRIASRKMVMLREDYDSLGVDRRAPGFCQPMDQICQLLHGERPTPDYKWQVNGPKTLPDMTTDLKEAIRNATLPDPVGTIDPKNFPTYDTNINTLLPFYDVPRPTDLTPSK